MRMEVLEVRSGTTGGRTRVTKVSPVVTLPSLGVGAGETTGHLLRCCNQGFREPIWICGVGASNGRGRETQTASAESWWDLGRTRVGGCGKRKGCQQNGWGNKTPSMTECSDSPGARRGQRQDGQGPDSSQGPRQGLGRNETEKRSQIGHSLGWMARWPDLGRQTGQ